MSKDKEKEVVVDEAIGEHIDVGKSKDEDGNTRFNFSISTKIIVPVVFSILVSVGTWVYQNIKEVPQLRKELNAMKKSYEVEKLNSYQNALQLLSLLKATSSTVGTVATTPTPLTLPTPVDTRTWWDNYALNIKPLPEGIVTYTETEEVNGSSGETLILQSDEAEVLPPLVDAVRNPPDVTMDEVTKKITELKKVYNKKIDIQQSKLKQIGRPQQMQQK